jgi:hypothetical protein
MLGKCRIFNLEASSTYNYNRSLRVKLGSWPLVQKDWQYPLKPSDNTADPWSVSEGNNHWIRMTNACILCIAGSTVEKGKELQPSTDVLISKADLLDKIQLIKDLSVRMCEFEKEQVYKEQKSELMHAQKLKELQESYHQATEELKKKNEVRII